MADHEPAGVVVSSNRFDDLKPYCGYIYNAEPQIWGSIFPWEFPQNAGKEDEECFLRRFFSDVECHMQGFMFLKQAWYCIALWNLEIRVPAVADFWWEQEDRKAYLDDDELKKWFFKPDVEPGTFFLASDMEMYGQKFLSYVVPRIQQTAKMMLEKQEAEKHASDIGPHNTPTDTASKDFSVDAPAKDTSSLGSDVAASDTKAIQADQISVSPTSSATIPHSSPVPFTDEPVPSRVISNGYQSTQEHHFHPRKRGNSGGRRFQTRGSGHFQGRQSFPNERGPTPFLPADYHNTPQLIYAVPGRVPSGNGFDFVPAGHQGQPVPGVPPQGTYMSQPFEHQAPMQQHTMPQAQYVHEQQHHHFTPHPFADRSNMPATNRVFSNESHSSSIDDHYQNWNGSRRDSQSSRGGKPRGYGSARGRGSRGRNSFTSSDQQPFAPYDRGIDRNFSNESAGVEHGLTRRRESIVGEKNWRNGRDHPQTHQGDHFQNENVYPGREFAGYGAQQMPFAPRPNYQSSMGQSYERKTEQQDFLQYTPNRGFSRPTQMRAPNTNKSNHFPPITPQTITPEKCCGKDYIGARCTYAVKLVLFNVPSILSAEQIRGFFRQFCQVDSVNVKQVPYDYRLALLFFKNHQQARQCLLNKPARWLDGEDLRVEVAKEYWDPFHKSYRPPDYLLSLGEYASPAHTINDRSGDTTPTLHGRGLGGEAVESRDTTPTPSAAGTPRKGKDKKRKNVSGWKKNKEKELLRASLKTVSEKDNAQIEAVDENSDTASVVTAVNLDQGANGVDATDAGESLALNTSVLQKDRAGSEQTERQTASEPSFTPTDNFEARFPPPCTEAEVADISSAPKETQCPSLNQAEVQTSAELAPSLTHEVDPDVSATTQEKPELFREGEKAEDKTQDMGEDGNEGSRELVKEAETPSKSDEEQLDDSFHTASGSPDSDKAVEGRDDGPSEEVKAESPIPLEGDSSSVGPRPKSTDTTQANVGAASASPPPVSPTPMPSAPAAPMKDSKRVCIPQLPSKSPAAAAASTGSEKKSDTSQTKERSISGASAVPPTPAFFTAPNTPAVPQEVQKPDEVVTALQSSRKIEVPKSDEIATALPPTEKIDIQKSDETATALPLSKKIEKPEKTKGPPQTESLSLFGKKKEKKPKPAKKGTLKGKPKIDGSFGSEVTSENTSRAVSGAATPVPQSSMHGVMGPTEVKKGDEDTTRKSFNVSEDADGKSETNTTESVTTTSSVQVTPSKARGTFSNILSGLFGAGQQSASNEARSEEAAPSKPSLTDIKAPARPQEIETMPLGSTCGETNTAGDISGYSDCESKPVAYHADAEETRDFSNTAEHGVHSPGVEEAVEAEVGLGISNTGSDSIASDDSKLRKKSNNRRKKKTRSKKKSDVASVDESQEGSPPTATAARPEIFRFTAGETPSPTHPRDDRSDTSSLTLGRDTPTSDGQSAIVSTSGRKLPTKSTDAGHLVVGKSPIWKHKKRVASARMSENTTVCVDEQGNVLYYVPESEGSETSAQDSQSVRLVESPQVGTGQPERLFVYIGHGKRDDAESAHVEESKRKMAELACEEAKRKLESRGEGTITDVSASSVSMTLSD